MIKKGTEMKLHVGDRIPVRSSLDVHVHLREPGGEDQETIASGTWAAFAGGYQFVADMPNNPNGMETHTEERLDQKRQMGQATANTKIGFYAGVNFDNPDHDELARMVMKSLGIKFYMGETTGNKKDRDLDTVRPTADYWIEQNRKAGKKSPILLHAIGEIGADTAEYIARCDYPVHWCHISTKKEAEMAAKLTTLYPGLFTSEVSPHALTMTERNGDQQGWNGARMQPVLGQEHDAQALMYYFNHGLIQILATDHAPHTHAAKMKAEAENPEGITGTDCTTCYGVSGIEFVWPIMATQIMHGHTSFERVEDALYTQPARMLGLDTSNDQSVTTLEIGPWVIGDKDVKGKSRNTPYVGWTAWAKVVSTEISSRNKKDAEYKYPGNAKVLETGALL